MIWAAMYRPFVEYVLLVCVLCFEISMMGHQISKSDIFKLEIAIQFILNDTVPKKYAESISNVISEYSIDLIVY